MINGSYAFSVSGGLHLRGRRFSSRARKLVFTQMDDGVTKEPIEIEGMQLCYVKKPMLFCSTLA